ncbi:hypothetical protein PZQ55_001228 [Clostridium botulinum]|nr:hypothetical protein [Clostridium botulinum]EKO2042251.1 hypothetical protein [Clostridium botulinum]
MCRIIKIIKKLVSISLVLSFIVIVLVGCGSNNDTKDSNTTTNRKVSTIDINKLKEELKKELGEGEVIKNISINGQELVLEIDLGKQSKIPIRDLAEVRYSGITDYLIDNGKWKIISANFVGVGKISMDVSNAVEEEVSGVKIKYFRGEDIRKNFK